MRLLLILALIVACVAGIRNIELPGLADKLRQRQGQTRLQRVKRDAAINADKVTPETHPQFFYGTIPRLSYLFRKEREEEERSRQ